MYHEHCNIDRSRRSLLIDFIGLKVCAISIATSGICITVTKAIHWAFELYARRTWDQIDVITGSNVDGIFQGIETIFYLTIDTWREVLLNILNLDFNHDETNMSKRPLTLVQCFHFFICFIMSQSKVVSSELDSIINVLGLSPEDPLDTFIGKLISIEFYNHNLYSEIWYQIFLWAFFTYLLIHSVAAAIAFASLRKHKVARFFPILILVSGVITPICVSLVSSK